MVPEDTQREFVPNPSRENASMGKVTQRMVQEQLNSEKKPRPVTGKVAMEQEGGIFFDGAMWLY